MPNPPRSGSINDKKVAEEGRFWRILGNRLLPPSQNRSWRILENRLPPSLGNRLLPPSQNPRWSSLLHKGSRVGYPPPRGLCFWFGYFSPVQKKEVSPGLLKKVPPGF